MQLENDIQAVPPTPKWVAIASAALAGWNVGLIAAFLIAIYLSIVAGKFTKFVVGSGSFFLVVGVSITLGVVIAIITGRRLVQWFARKRQVVAYALLAALMVLSLLSFPAMFPYSITP